MILRRYRIGHITHRKLRVISSLGLSLTKWGTISTTIDPSASKVYVPPIMHKQEVHVDICCDSAYTVRRLNKKHNDGITRDYMSVLHFNG